MNFAAPTGIDKMDVGEEATVTSDKISHRVHRR